MHRLFAGLLLIAVSGFGQTKPAATPAPTPAKKSAPSSAQHSSSDDVAIEAAIRAKLAKSKISVDKFEVHVQGGIATITGKTNVLQHKGVATRLAKTGGAKQVVNKVQLSEEAKEKAASNLSSGARRAQVKRSDVPNRN